MRHIPRIYTPNKLETGVQVALDSNATHHLLHVMRMQNGSDIKLFNKDCGEWLATCNISKKNIIAICKQNIAHYQSQSIRVNLAFSLIAPTKMSFILEKCTELGVNALYPLITDYSQYSVLNVEKAKRIIVSAVEQCHRLDIPTIYAPMTLAEVLVFNTTYIVADMSGENIKTVVSRLSSVGDYNITIIVGPEGGFSQNELWMLKQHPKVILTKFGNFIMRSETASIVAVSGISLLLSK